MPAAALLPPALWRDITCEWLWVYHGMAPRVLEWSQEITVPAGVFFVESGCVKIQAEGKETVVRPGQAFFSAPGRRKQWFAEATRMLSVGLRLHWAEGLPIYKAGLNLRLPMRELKALHEATQALFSSVHGRKKEVGYAEGTTERHRTLAEWTRHEAGFRQWAAEYVTVLEKQGICPTPRTGMGDRRLEHLRLWLQERPLDQTLDLKPIADELSLSPRRVHDLLQQELGMTAQVYLDRRRLEQARLRLIQGDTALKEIAFGLGFRHPPHFTAWFRRHTGMTPTAYRDGQGLQGA